MGQLRCFKQKGCFRSCTTNTDETLDVRVKGYGLRFFMALASGDDRSPPHQGKPDQVLDRVKQGFSTLSLDNMCYDVLLEIVSHLPFITNSPEEACDTLFALGMVNRYLHEFYQYPQARGTLFANILEKWGDLGQIDYTDLTTGLNLDPRALEVGLGLYVRNPKNGFAKAFALDKEIQELVITLFESAKLKFQEKGSPSVSYEVRESFDPRYYGEYDEPFSIYVGNKRILIVGPFHTVSLRETCPKETTLSPPLLAIFRVLINRLGATIDYTISRSDGDSEFSYHKFSDTDSSDDQIRKTTDWHPTLINNLTGLSHQMIVPLDDRVECVYKMKKIGETFLHPKYFHGLFSHYFDAVSSEDFVKARISFALNAACLFYSGNKNKDGSSLCLNQKIHRIAYIIDCFWGADNLQKVIPLLCRKLSLGRWSPPTVLSIGWDELDEIYTFIITNLIVPYKENRKTKEEIVKDVGSVSEIEHFCVLIGTD